jgi:Flp pilus assembly pilin Flp
MISLRIAMKNILYQIWKNEDGQDLIEYTLLLAFVTLGSAALFTGAGKSTSTIWSAASSTLSNAAAKVNPS